MDELERMRRLANINESVDISSTRKNAQKKILAGLPNESDFKNLIGTKMFPRPGLSTSGGKRIHQDELVGELTITGIESIRILDSYYKDGKWSVPMPSLQLKVSGQYKSGKKFNGIFSIGPW